MGNRSKSKPGPGNTAPVSPFPSPRKERLVIAAFLLGMLLLAILIATKAGISDQNRLLDARMARWKATYHLTADQVARIREIELRFHGNGNPFTTRAGGTEEENAAHHLEISQVMPPEEGARFLKDLRRPGNAH